MNNYSKYVDTLKTIVDIENIKINEPMKLHTSFKVGGPADILITPNKVEEIQRVISLCKENHIPYFIMGNGSNMIVSDKGIRGFVIKIEKLDTIEVKGDIVRVGCGKLLTEVSKKAGEHGLSGLEFACGIPGSIGGAIAMNAGAYGGEIKDVLKEVVVLDKEGKIITLHKESLELGYRQSAVLNHGYIAIEGIFKLKKGSYREIKATMDDLNKKREDKQPLEYPSAGSTFKRPVGYFAGKLIQDSNLSGYSIGGAEVSSKHSGFVINKGDATAKDILDLIHHVQKTVKDKFGVQLHTEVRIVGEI